MGDIKSAHEIAMEKVARIGEATEEERLKWKYVPVGEKLAAKYIREAFNLSAELGHYEEKAQKYVTVGAVNILIRNINLPKDDLAQKNNKRAMEGIKTLKSDKVGVENIFSGVRRIFSHYVEQGEQQKKQAYQSLKAEFEAKAQQAIQQQMGVMMGAKIDVERIPQFQEEWHQVLNQLDSQYIKLLEEYKQQLLEIA